jgi:hypothetical protein
MPDRPNLKQFVHLKSGDLVTHPVWVPVRVSTMTIPSLTIPTNKLFVRGWETCRSLADFFMSGVFPGNPFPLTPFHSLT